MNTVVEPTSITSVSGADNARKRPKGLLREALRYKRTRIGLALTGALVLLALFGPLFAPHTPEEFVGAQFASPSGAAPLGTDYLGADVLSRILYGGRSVLWMSLSAALLGVALGATIGMVAGYSRNYLDNLLMRPLEIIQGFPQIVLVLLFVSLVGPKLWLIVVLVGIAWVPSVARVIRAVTQEITSREYVEAAEVIGVPRRRILRTEILPNIMTPLMVELGLRVTYSVALIAGVSFLGFGVQPPAADWGLMINENRPGLAIQPWPVVIPVICIALLTVGTNLITEGIARTAAGFDRDKVN